MLKKVTSLMTVLTLFFATGFSDVVSAATKEEKEARKAKEIKQKVEKLKNSKRNHVTVGLKNNTSFHGYVSDVSEESFIVINSKTREANKVEYRDILYFDKHMSHRKMLFIAGGICAGLAIFTAVAISTTPD
jgi:hypothetical protein